MKKFLTLILLAALAVGCGATKAQTDVGLDLNKAQATTYTDLAVFTRKVLTAGLNAAPAEKKQFWRDGLAALDANASEFERENRDLMRLILTMSELDPAAQQRYIEDLTTLIIAAKTGTIPPATVTE